VLTSSLCSLFHIEFREQNLFLNLFCKFLT
jgi:hypothetical protein